MTQREATILVLGNFNDYAVQRLSGEFNIKRIPKGDAALVEAAWAGDVKGVASMSTVDAKLIDALPNLEIIGNFGVGYDAVDAKHAGANDVMVTNTPDVLTEEVADTALGLLIDTVRELSKSQEFLRAGRWPKEGRYPLSKLSLRGRSVGIFGLGRIGKAIAHRVEAFGLPVSYHNRRKADDVSYTYYPSLLELAKAVDTLILVAPGGAETAKAIDADVLKALGPEGVLINIGRGSVVDEDALAQALTDGTIAAAGLDVFANEPNVPQALLDAPNTVLLPHIGSASEKTRRDMANLVIDNLISWFDNGEAITPVPETSHVKKK
ncbi:2-hydroxyacid dehydrogenase [Ochrobactrum sp. SD129]|jgi:lactate dehydrogenase-like 2-hydroxyacid dehydrogenase|uniref:2-hydroxyacid dehydrogenase n=1 Tax=Brucella pseudogrignonensis TaxID=419475 RepID=UPI000DD7E68E|nr:2-hydroxyacid dehydrogenase [Brucella pseudogrignonensis]MBK0023583.1 2-hydroxyacid dehydrogenase [Ochrobactrum sp. S45]MBK0045622.1 2-hydroxyacid dehydrogenase [Ochrobactrum sp. S46]MBO1023155.1 2-hydroxyacid dehydrogenase [Ochrobactrum sp. SD129]KAB2692237.1 2-hydroxyacid dehydrogenase [Brucella pseudogrignonensis]UKK92843.1 2-hydroxyacid dehydrogenase [Brucella pseudogrignonensis]